MEKGKMSFLCNVRLKAKELKINKLKQDKCKTVQEKVRMEIWCRSEGATWEMPYILCQNAQGSSSGSASVSHILPRYTLEGSR